MVMLMVVIAWILIPTVYFAISTHPQSASMRIILAVSKWLLDYRASCKAAMRLSHTGCRSRHLIWYNVLLIVLLQPVLVRLYGILLACTWIRNLGALNYNIWICDLLCIWYVTLMSMTHSSLCLNIWLHLLQLIIEVVPRHLASASMLHTHDLFIGVIHYDTMRLILLLYLPQFHAILIYL